MRNTLFEYTLFEQSPKSYANVELYSAQSPRALGALLLLIFLGVTLMASKIISVNVKGVDVPVIFEHDHNLPIVSMQLVLRNSGSINDGSLTGLARISASILNEGTLKDGSLNFAKKLEEKAINLSAHSGNETFVYEIGSLRNVFDEAIVRLSELLKTPNVTKETIKKVKTNTVGSITQKLNDFDYIAGRELKALLFKGTVLENASIGTLDTVKKIKLKDVKDFIDRSIVLERAVIVIGGDISESEAKHYAKAILKSLPHGELKKLDYIKTSDEIKQSVIKKDTEQAYIYFGSKFNMTASDSDYYKARIGMHILGAGGFGSRLMEEIRVKRGLAYSAYARVAVNNSHSYFNGYLQTKLENQDEALKIVKEVIGEYLKNGVTQDELDAAKKFLLGSEPLRVETLSQRLSRAFFEYYKGKELGHSLKELELIEKLELEDLNTFIKSHNEIMQLSVAVVTK